MANLTSPLHPALDAAFDHAEYPTHQAQIDAIRDEIMRQAEAAQAREQSLDARNAFLSDLFLGILNIGGRGLRLAGRMVLVTRDRLAQSRQNDADRTRAFKFPHGAQW